MRLFILTVIYRGIPTFLQVYTSESYAKKYKEYITNQNGYSCTIEESQYGQ